MWHKAATLCCACGKVLEDATSVEFGIGPVCRKKYHYQDAPSIAGHELEIATYATNHLPADLALKVTLPALADNSRKVANLLVYYCSAEQTGAGVVHAAHLLRVMGYTVLADRIIDRILPIKVTEMPDDRIAVKTPFNENFLSLIRGVRGRKFEKQTENGLKKVWTFPVAAKLEVWGALKGAFAGLVGVGPKGVFTVA